MNLFHRCNALAFSVLICVAVTVFASDSTSTVLLGKAKIAKAAATSDSEMTVYVEVTRPGTGEMMNKFVKLSEQETKSFKANLGWIFMAGDTVWADIYTRKTH